MPPPSRVVVCGSSLYMASLAAGLQAATGFEVARVLASPADMRDCLGGFEANVIAFDLAELPVDLPVALLRERPNLLLLGMDPTSQDKQINTGQLPTTLLF